MGRKSKATPYRKHFEGGKLNKEIKRCTDSAKLYELWEKFIRIAREERNARLLNNIDIVEQCEKFIKEIEGRIDYKTDMLDIILYKDLLLKIERERGSLYRQGVGGIKSANTKKAKDKKDYSEWTTLNCHTYSTNNLYVDRDGRQYKSKGYMTWIANFPTWQVPPPAEYFKQGIDLFAPLGIEVQLVQKAECDVDNGIKSLLDRLASIWDLPSDNHITSVSICRVDTCTNFEDGEIRFRVFNI